MCIATEPTEEIGHLLVQHCVTGDRGLEFLQFVGRRQIAIQQQEADFEIMRFSGQLIDRIAAVQQHTFFAINEGNRAVAACSRGKAGIVGEYASLRIEFPDVQNIGARRRRIDWQVIVVAIKAQRGGFGRFSHTYPFL